MGQKSGSAWLWVLAGAGALYAALSHQEPTPPTRPPEPIVQAAIAAPTVTAPPTASAAELLLVAKRLLLLTHTGNFRSRDLHARALAALALIPTGTPEHAEAIQLQRGIVSAYTSKAGTPPTPDSSAFPSDLLQALEGPIALPSLAKAAGEGDPSGSQPGGLAPGPTLAFVGGNPSTVPTPAPAPRANVPGCAENGSCYGDISDATGLPKTTAVRGYTRADGTYVRGYYRSK
jgi:hypothetical protein